MSKPENLKCPECGGDMVSRLNKTNQTRFWGCKNYPQCRGTRDVDGWSKNEKYKREDHEDTGPDAFDHVNRWNKR